MQNEISREAFTELVILELSRQGLQDKASKAKDGEVTLMNSATWTAQRTHRALLFDQPRADVSGLRALAIAIEKKASVEESKDDSSSPNEDDSWLLVSRNLVEGICSVASTSPSADASRLASALFVDCIYFSLFSPNGNLQWLDVDVLSITAHLSGTILKEYRPQNIRAWTQRVAEIVAVFEHQSKHESWKKYLHLLRECVVVEATSCASSALDMTRFETACQALTRCTPTSEILLSEYWDCFSGVARDLKKNMTALSKLSERALSLLPSITEALNSSGAADLRAPDVASALGVVDVILATNDQLAFKAVSGAGIVRYGAVAFGERKFGAHDVFLGTFLMRLAWKSEKACDFMLAFDPLRQRALAAADPPISTPSERALWALVLASCSSSTAPARELAEVIALERIAVLDVKNCTLFLRTLNDPALLAKVRQWKHVQIVLNRVEAMRPVRPTTVSEDGKEAVDDDFAGRLAIYKRVLSGLRGGSGGID